MRETARERLPTARRRPVGTAASAVHLEAQNKMAPTNGAISLLCRTSRSTGRYEASPSVHGQRKRFSQGHERY